MSSLRANATLANQPRFNASATWAASTVPSARRSRGIEIFLNGLFNGTEVVILSVFDKDIHSGVPRVNPFGLTVDSYVLQGGDRLGRDTGDNFEVTQAAGHFSFVERVANVPEPGSIALIAVAMLAMPLRRRALSRAHGRA